MQGFRQINEKTITPEIAQREFHYDKETGKLYRNYAGGRELTGFATNGYNFVKINGQTYRSTHIIWLIVYGRHPSGIIDHEDTNGMNDRFTNLREATQSQNIANASKYRNNKSGIKGVSWNKAKRKWTAQIGYNYTTIYLGQFDNIEEAKEAYNTKAKELFGEFARP